MRGKTDEEIVALRKESVDRNMLFVLLGFSFVLSLSARRAWIEIRYAGIFIDAVDAMSLSARRAWIEISARRRCL